MMSRVSKVIRREKAQPPVRVLQNQSYAARRGAGQKPPPQGPILVDWAPSASARRT